MPEKPAGVTLSAVSSAVRSKYMPLGAKWVEKCRESRPQAGQKQRKSR